MREYCDTENGIYVYKEELLPFFVHETDLAYYHNYLSAANLIGFIEDINKQFKIQTKKYNYVPRIILIDYTEADRSEVYCRKTKRYDNSYTVITKFTVNFYGGLSTATYSGDVVRMDKILDMLIAQYKLKNVKVKNPNPKEKTARQKATKVMEYVLSQIGKPYVIIDKEAYSRTITSLVDNFEPDSRNYELAQSYYLNPETLSKKYIESQIEDLIEYNTILVADTPKSEPQPAKTVETVQTIKRTIKQRPKRIVREKSVSCIIPLIRDPKIDNYALPLHDNYPLHGNYSYNY